MESVPKLLWVTEGCKPLRPRRGYYRVPTQHSSAIGFAGKCCEKCAVSVQWLQDLGFQGRVCSGAGGDISMRSWGWEHWLTALCSVLQKDAVLLEMTNGSRTVQVPPPPPKLGFVGLSMLCPCSSSLCQGQFLEQ